MIDFQNLSHASGEELWQMAGLASAMSSAPNIALMHRILTEATASPVQGMTQAQALSEISAKYLENAAHYALAMADYMTVHAADRLEAARRDYEACGNDYQRRRLLDQAIAEIAPLTQLSETLVRLLLLAMFAKDAPPVQSLPAARRVAVQ
jgi:hypothetical protein